MPKRLSLDSHQEFISNDTKVLLAMSHAFVRKFRHRSPSPSSQHRAIICMNPLIHEICSQPHSCIQKILIEKKHPQRTSFTSPQIFFNVGDAASPKNLRKICTITTYTSSQLCIYTAIKFHGQWPHNDSNGWLKHPKDWQRTLPKNFPNTLHTARTAPHYNSTHPPSFGYIAQASQTFAPFTFLQRYANR